MSSCREAMLRLLLAAATLTAAAGSVLAQQTAYPGVGRAATPKELQAWDIDVRPDFKGLPKGAGSVAKGMDVWESKCASCHGIFGESNEVFSPLVGGSGAFSVTRLLQERDQADLLEPYFEPLQSPAERTIAQTEGWILGLR